MERMGDSHHAMSFWPLEAPEATHFVKCGQSQFCGLFRADTDAPQNIQIFEEQMAEQQSLKDAACSGIAL